MTMVTTAMFGAGWADPSVVALGAAGARSALLLALVLGLSFALRRASAATRHALWGAGFVLVLALPLAALLPWRLPVLPAAFSPATIAAGQGAPRTAAAQYGPFAGAELDGSATPTVSEGATTRPEPDAATPRFGEPASAVEAGGFTLPSVPTLLLLGWLAGIAFVGGRLVLGHLVVGRVVRRAEPLTDASWTTPLWESADRLEIDHDVRLLRSDESAIPFATGALRPTIVLPAAAEKWDDHRRRAVLMHELAHVRRRDLLLHYVSRWSCALYWFNPLAWIGARRLRAESERAADDMVLEAGTRPSDYADHLLQIVAHVGRVGMPAPALPLAQRREFEGRMLAILEPGLSRRGTSRVRTAAITLGLALIALPLAALAPAPPKTLADAAELNGNDVAGSDDVAGPVRDAPVGPLAMTDDPAADPAGDPPMEGPGRTDRGLRADGRGEPAAADRDSNSNGGSNSNTNSNTETGNDRTRTRTTTSLQVRTEAVTDGTPAAVGAVLAALGDKGSRSDDPRAVAALVRLLREDSDAEVRRAAANALGELEAEEAVPALADALRKDASADVRHTAAWALGQIESAAAVPALVAALGDSSRDVRETATWALGQIEDSSAVPALVRVLRGNEIEVARKAAWALGQIEDPAAVDGLVAALSSSDAELRQTAAWALGQIEDGRAAPGLVKLMKDSNSEVRAAAIHALGQLDDEAAVPGLVQALADPDPNVRAYAAHALGDVDIRSAPPELTRLLRDSSPQVRAAAAQALGEIEDESTADDLAAVLKDAVADVRRAVLEALASMDSDVATDALVEALRDESPEVRRKAAEALGHQ